MSAKRTILFAALTGLLLYNFIAIPPANAQVSGECRFIQPILGGSPNGDFAYGEETPFEAHHTGLDYIYPAGTPVLAVESGEVVYAGWWPPEGISREYGFGYSVFVKHNDCGGMLTFYSHLNPNIPVVQGQQVYQGQILGNIGETGSAPAQNIADLHFGVSPTGDPIKGYAWGGQWLDPKAFFSESAPVEMVAQPPMRETVQVNVDLVGGIVLVVGAALVVILIALAIWRPSVAWSVAKATGRAGLGAIGTGFNLWYWVDAYSLGILRDERRRSKKIYWSAIIAGTLLVIPLACLASLPVILGGQVQAWQPRPSGQISPIFTPEVQAWAPKIEEWARMYDLDKNLVSTIMQIESCGDASAVSPSGAQGLFQVMPFHFVSGEDMQDPDTNARRGMEYLRQTIAAYPDDLGRAIAAYNGGISGVSDPDAATWAAETLRYAYWGYGIYRDAVGGATSSEVLSEWLAVDRGHLCPSTLR